MSDPNVNTQAEIYAQIRDNALEEAAKVCEREICNCCWDDEGIFAAEHLADKIRSLKAKEAT